MSSSKPIITIGEVVWDLFPGRQVLGGAPVNVAYHLVCLGEPVTAVTRVGSDALGEAAFVRMRELGVPLSGVQRDPELASGSVRIEIGPGNEPHFDIATPAAWDAIDPLEALAAVGDRQYELVFGTLGQRRQKSREAIRTLWQKASFRYYDVNLRPPFTDRDLVLTSCAAADLVKVNEQELGIIGDWLGLREKSTAALAGRLRERYRLTALAVTRGAEGALLAAAGEIFETPGIAIEVADTVGAGDCFFATLIAGFRRDMTWQDALSWANRRASYVASRHGATPDMGEAG